MQQDNPVTLSPQPPQFFLVPRNETGGKEYEKFTSLTDVMPVNISGIVTAHDDLVVDFEDKRLIYNASVLRDPSLAVEEARTLLGVKDNAGWKLAKAREVMRKSKGDTTYLQDYGYRPFDIRRIYYHPAIVWSDRRNVMSHILDGGNVALATCRQLASAPWQHVFVTRHLQDDCFVSNRTRERSYHFPMELRGPGQRRGAQIELLSLDGQAMPNLSKAFLLALSASFDSSTTLTDVELSSEAFSYIYAVLHSGTYRTRYAEFLKVDFPRIPLPGGLKLFRDLASFGKELVALHLLESSNINKQITTYIGPKAPRVQRIGWSDDTVWIDAAATKMGLATKPGTVGFRGVPEAVWKFRIGCYQVCEKWLKDRKDRTLSPDDIAHYQKIVVALHETMRLMKEIDKVVEKNGGWPGAFGSGV